MLFSQLDRTFSASQHATLWASSMEQAEFQDFAAPQPNTCSFMHRWLFFETSGALLLSQTLRYNPCGVFLFPWEGSMLKKKRAWSLGPERPSSIDSVIMLIRATSKNENISLSKFKVFQKLHVCEYMHMQLTLEQHRFGFELCGLTFT